MDPIELIPVKLDRTEPTDRPDDMAPLDRAPALVLSLKKLVDMRRIRRCRTTRCSRTRC